MNHTTLVHPTGAARALSLAGALAALIAATGCSDATGTDRRITSVSFTSATSVQASSSAMFAASTIPVTSGGHTLDLASADLVIHKVKLRAVESEEEEHRDDVEVENGQDHDDDNDAQIRSGPVTVSLPLSGGVITPFSAPVPVGTYDRLKLDTDSLHLKGTYDGQAFDVTIPMHLELQMRLDPPLAITSSSTPNVTVGIDVLKWFQSSGGLIDPRKLSSDSTLRATLQNSIRASFRAFKDDDHDGRDHDQDDHDDHR